MTTTSLSGFATQANPVSRIVCAYASAPFTLVAADSDDADEWFVIGSFTVPELVAAKLAVEGQVVGGALMTVRLYGPAPIANSDVSVSSTVVATHVSSGLMSLAPNTQYLIAAKCEVAVPAAGIQGIINTVHLTD